MLKVILLSLMLVAPAYASDRHKPPEPTPINVPDDGSNHNALVMGIVIFATVACVYHKCWKPKKMVADKGIAPEIPKNEYTYQVKP